MAAGTANPRKSPSGRALGRPTKFTQENVDRIVEAIARGLPRESAARLVGAEPESLFRWLRTGRESESGPYRDFYDRVQRADAVFEGRMVENIEQVALGDYNTKVTRSIRPDGTLVEEASNGTPQWAASAWLLERKFNQRWGKTERLEIEHSIRDEAKKVAEALGIGEEEVLAEAEKLLQAI